MLAPGFLHYNFPSDAKAQALCDPALMIYHPCVPVYYTSKMQSYVIKLISAS